jgi:hypothetical protein
LKQENISSVTQEMNPNFTAAAEFVNYLLIFTSAGLIIDQSSKWPLVILRPQAKVDSRQLSGKKGVGACRISFAPFPPLFVVLQARLDDLSSLKN